MGNVSSLQPRVQPGGTPLSISPGNLTAINAINAEKLASSTNAAERRDFYHYQNSQNSKQVIPIDVGVKQSIPDFNKKFDAAFRPNNTYLEEVPETRMSRYVLPVSTTDVVRRNYEFCRTIARPEDLRRPHPPDLGAQEGYGCGWYYRDSDSKKSFAVYGNIAGSQPGPHPRIAQFPTDGVFIAEKDIAIKKEAIKRCAAITVCSHLTGDDGCGFCITSGKGIPINSTDNSPKYTNPADGATCGTVQIIASATACPSTTQDICTRATDAAGRRSCLLTVLDGLQITTGALRECITAVVDGSPIEVTTAQAERILVLKSLYENSRMDHKFYITEDELKGEAVNLTAALFRMKVQKIKAIADQVKQAPAASTIGNLVIDLAQILVGSNSARTIAQVKTAYFSSLGSESEKNPASSAMALSALQTEFLKTGCQASGSAFPTSLMKAAGKSLPQMISDYQSVYSSMAGAQLVSEQEAAVRSCLNAAAYGSGETGGSGTFCNERGVEYFVYAGRYNDGKPITLIGRVISNVGLLKDPTAGTGTIYGLARDLKRLLTDAESPEVSYRLRTMTSVPAGFSNTSKIEWGLASAAASASYTVRVNGELKGLGDAANVLFSLNNRSRLEIEFTANTNGQSYGSPRFAYMEQNLERFQLFQESIKPFLSFDFFKQTLVDSNGIGDLAYKNRASYTKNLVPNGIEILDGSEMPIIPNVISSMIRLVVCRIYIKADSGLKTIYKVRGTGDYVESLLVSSGRITYSIQNGVEGTSSVSGAMGPALAEGWHTIAVQLNKTGLAKTRVLGMLTLTYYTIIPKVFVDRKEIVMTSDADNKDGSLTSVGTMGFQRSLQIVLSGGVPFERFHVYDKVFEEETTPTAAAPRAAGSVESFQTYSDASKTSLDTILDMEAGKYSRAKAVRGEATDADYSIRGDLLAQATLSPASTGPSPASTGPSPASATFSPVSTGPSPVCPVAMPPSNSATFYGALSYTPVQEVGYTFANADRGNFSLDRNIFALKNAFNACYDSATCVAFTFDAVKGEMQRYTKIQERDGVGANAARPFFNTVKEGDNIISVIMPGRDATLAGLRTRAREAINSYKEMLTRLKNENIYDKLFDTKNTSAILQRLFLEVKTILPEEPRTLADCDKDLTSVDVISDKACLNALALKYSASDPSIAPGPASAPRPAPTTSAG